jgi:hypothetical protein
MDFNGVIALQVHAGKETQVRFRNIQLQGGGTSALTNFSLSQFHL